MPGRRALWDDPRLRVAAARMHYRQSAREARRAHGTANNPPRTGGADSIGSAAGRRRQHQAPPARGTRQGRGGPVRRWYIASAAGDGRGGFRQRNARGEAQGAKGARGAGRGGETPKEHRGTNRSTPLRGGRSSATGSAAGRLGRAGAPGGRRRDRVRGSVFGASVTGTGQCSEGKGAQSPLGSAARL